MKLLLAALLVQRASAVCTSFCVSGAENRFGTAGHACLSGSTLFGNQLDDTCTGCANPGNNANTQAKCVGRGGTWTPFSCQDMFNSIANTPNCPSNAVIDGLIRSKNGGVNPCCAAAGGGGTTPAPVIPVTPALFPGTTESKDVFWSLSSHSDAGCASAPIAREARDMATNYNYYRQPFVKVYVRNDILACNSNTLVCPVFATSCYDTMVTDPSASAATRYNMIAGSREGFGVYAAPDLATCNLLSNAAITQAPAPALAALVGAERAGARIAAVAPGSCMGTWGGAVGMRFDGVSFGAASIPTTHTVVRAPSSALLGGKKKDDNIGAIAGGAAGGAVVILLLVLWWCKCRGQGQKAAPRPSPAQGVPMQTAPPQVVVPIAGAGNKFDPNTGAPIPKFDPNTGKQNWS